MKTLTVYFSATSTTKKQAVQLSKIVESDLYEIKMEVPYVKKDLNWINPFSRSTKEMKGKLPEPAIIQNDIDLKEYDTILLCFPIWWGVAPTAVNSFLRAYDFSGKTIYLFATSGGSKLGDSASKLKECVNSKTIIKDGCMINTINEQEIKSILRV